MLEFTIEDFNIKNQKQKIEVRSKLDEIGTELVWSAKLIFPSTQWGHYVTGKTSL